MDGSHMSVEVYHGYTAEQMQCSRRMLLVAETPEAAEAAFRAARPHIGRNTVVEAVRLLSPAMHRFMDLLLHRSEGVGFTYQPKLALEAAQDYQLCSMGQWADPKAPGMTFFPGDYQ